MFTMINKLPEPNPVNAGQRAALRVPTGPTYRQFIITHTDNGVKATEAQMIANIEEVSIKINGTKRFSVTGETAVMLSKYYNNDIFNDGELVIDLVRHWARTVGGEENLAWGTQNIANMHLEIKLAAGIVNPTLSVDAVVTPDKRDLGTIIEIHEMPYEAISGGKKEISDLPKLNGSLVAIHLKSTLITALEVKLGDIPVIENDANLTAYQNNLVRIAGRNLQSGYIHIDAAQNNRMGEAWPLEKLQRFNVNPTISGAGSIDIIMETLFTPLLPITRK